MDLLKYQTDRETDLQGFRKDYDDLKVQYRRVLLEAVYEKDPAAQAGLIKQVLDTNAELSTHIREFLGKPNNTFDPKTVSDLTEDIVKYQKEYSDIRNSEHKVNTVRSILTRKETELDAVQMQFNVLLALLGLGILVLIILIFRSATTQWQLPQVFPPPSNSLVETV
jgi:hypothetical protein